MQDNQIPQAGSPDAANDAKADFKRIYTQPTPHDYYQHLGRLDYSICDEIRPFCHAAAALLRRGRRRVRMLDIGCSYGINAATVRFGLSFSELNRLFELNVPRDPARAAAVTKQALENHGTHLEVECGGLDASGLAIRFATESGILEHGIHANLEEAGAELNAEDHAWTRDVNLLVCTGAIGYVTRRTLDKLLDAIGDRAPETIVLMTVLRVFDTSPIERSLDEHGLACEILPDVLMPQRRFADRREQQGIIDVLEQARLDAKLERSGRHFARLLVATGGDKLPVLADAMRSLAASRPTLPVSS